MFPVIVLEVFDQVRSHLNGDIDRILCHKLVWFVKTLF
jgi:hypothetical protein